MFDGICGVCYREMQSLRRRLLRNTLASMLSPMLFLAAFGYGFGRQRFFYGMDYLDFLFAGLLAMSTLNACYSVSSEINISRFYFKTFEEYLLAPVPRWQIVAGETLYGMSKGSINTLIFLALAWLIDLKISLNLVFALVMLLHMAAFSLLGILIALAVKNHGDQSTISSFIITPMIFLSGIFFPVEHAPTALKWTIQLLPVSHSVSLIRASLYNGAMDKLNLAVLAGFTALFFMLALRLAARSGAEN